MNIREALLAEHSKEQTAKIVDYIGGDPERFAVLMRLFLGDVYRVTQRSVWPLSDCIKKYPELIKPYFAKLLKQLERDDVHLLSVAMLSDFFSSSRYQNAIRVKYSMHAITWWLIRRSRLLSGVFL